MVIDDRAEWLAAGGYDSPPARDVPTAADLAGDDWRPTVDRAETERLVAQVTRLQAGAR